MCVLGRDRQCDIVRVSKRERERVSKSERDMCELSQPKFFLSTLAHRLSICGK